LISERVARRYVAKLVRIDEPWVDKIRKDFLALMKNIPKIKDYDTGMRLKGAINLWSDRFESLFFRQFLNDSLPMDHTISDKELATYSKTLQHTGWEFLSVLAGMPLRQATGHGHSTKEDNFYDFERDVSSWVKRVKRKAQIFWKQVRTVARDYAQRAQAGPRELTVDAPDVEKVVLEGFRVEMRGFRPDYDPDVLGLEQIKGALKIYRRRASQVAPVLLKRQLPIAVDFRISTHLGGTYHGDHIVIGGNATDPKDRVRTLAHEMGHYIFERVLSRDATEFWAKLISGDYGELDIREVVSKWPEHQLASEYVKLLATQDPILAIQLDTVRQGYSSLSRYPIGRGDFQRLVDEGTYKVSVPKNPITGYAGKSPEEAFCETLGMLVAYGPGAVLPQIRHWLKVIMPGEIKVSQNIAERIARRYVAFTGEITVKDIDRWKKDLRRMTKIYRSIKPVDSYNDPEGYRRAQEVAKEAKALWRTFTERFETWGYRVLLPRVKKEDRESSFEANIRSAVSDAAYRTWPSELFPEVRSRDGSFQKDPDIDLSELKSRRNRRVKSYQRAFVKLFSWVESYINSVGGGALKRRAPIET